LKRRFESTLSENEFDAKSMLNLVAETVKSTSLYGPVFQKMTAQYAVRFLAKKIRDPNPPAIETLSDCLKYITDNMDKHLDGFCSLAYGVGKAQSILEGGIASGGRSIIKDGMETFLGKTDITSMYEGVTGTTEILKTQIDMQKMMHMMLGEITLAGDEDSCTISYKGCRFADSCVAMEQEGIRRVGGSIECSTARSHEAMVEHITKIAHDYEIINRNPPNCTLRVFKVK
jgi:hypothetical protein